MKIEETLLPGVVVIQPSVFGDERGFFYESFQASRYRDLAGINETFVQDNHSRSRKGVLRGLHFQRTRPQGKLVWVTRGEVFDVAVDINPESPTYSKWVGVNLSEHNHTQLYVPPGYAHGFLVLSDIVDFQYKCTEFYHPSDEGGLAWDDPVVKIQWPDIDPILSEKDSKNPTLDQLHTKKG